MAGPSRYLGLVGGWVLWRGPDGSERHTFVPEDDHEENAHGEDGDDGPGGGMPLGLPFRPSSLHGQVRNEIRCRFGEGRCGKVVGYLVDDGEATVLVSEPVLRPDGTEHRPLPSVLSPAPVVATPIILGCRKHGVIVADGADRDRMVTYLLGLRPPKAGKAGQRGFITPLGPA